MKIEQVHQFFQVWVKPLSKFMSRISWAVLFLMMLLTITDVVLRKTLSQSILGTVEITEFMLVIVIFFALANTEILNGHVKVDLVMSRFSGRVQSFVDMITQFVCFILSVMITWSTLIYSKEMRASAEVTQDLWIPIYPFIYVVALGSAVLALTLLIKFFLALGKVVKS
jgi:TRAP-type C4-dicarboxylate transport system permease small subunit